MPNIKITEDTKCWQGCMGMGTLVYCGKEYIGRAIKENSMEVLSKKLNVELPCGPAIPLLGIYSKEMKSLTQNVYE